MTALLVVVTFVVLIVVHEFGHFVMAKLMRVRVDEFGVGYPPRAFLLGKWGGTEYTINWLPLGGFVRLYGDEETAERGPGSFQRARRRVQAAILVAGVAMNLILAWLLFAAALHSGVPTVVDDPRPSEAVQLFVTDVVPGSPAAAGGITAGDEILGMTDKDGVSLAARTPSQVLAFVSVHGGQEITVSFRHDGKEQATAVRPANAVVPGEADRPALGVGLALVAMRTFSWPEAFVGASRLTYMYCAATIGGVWQLIAGSFTLSAPIQDVVGPVGLVSLIGEAAQNGFGNVLKLAGFISVNLAIINLIPIPALDGGRLVMLGIEAVMKRPAPRLAVQILNTFGIALIMLLMVVVTYHDIMRLLA